MMVFPKQCVQWVAVCGVSGMLLATSCYADAVLNPASGVQNAAQYQPDTQVERFLDSVRAARAEQQAYSGTFVMSDGVNVTSTRVQYACNGKRFVERMDALGGAPQTTLYDDQQMYSVLPDQKRMVVAPYHRTPVPLHALHKANLKEVSRYYRMRNLPAERVAGMSARVVELSPQDAWRYGYRVWVNDEYHWVLKLETWHQQQMLEHMMFTNIHVEEDAQKNYAQLKSHTQAPNDYVVEKAVHQQSKPSVVAEKNAPALECDVPGFYVVEYQTHTETHTLPNTQTVQSKQRHWMLSDGLSTASIFVEPFHPQLHDAAMEKKQMRSGATIMWAQRMGDDWVVAAGEVPLQTLQRLVHSVRFE